MDQSDLWNRIKRSQKLNLSQLRKWSDKFQPVNGVNVVSCLNYSLIQMINRDSLEELLEDSGQ